MIGELLNNAAYSQYTEDHNENTGLLSNQNQGYNEELANENQGYNVPLDNQNQGLEENNNQIEHQPVY